MRFVTYSENREATGSRAPISHIRWQYRGIVLKTFRPLICQRAHNFTKIPLLRARSSVASIRRVIASRPTPKRPTRANARAKRSETIRRDEFLGKIRFAFARARVSLVTSPRDGRESARRHATLRPRAARSRSDPRAKDECSSPRRRESARDERH